MVSNTDTSTTQRRIARVFLAVAMTLGSVTASGGEASAQTAQISPQLKWITGFTLANLGPNQHAVTWQNTDILHSVGIRRFGGYSGVPTLELIGAPAGLRVVALPGTPSPTSGDVMFGLHADASTPPGLYNTRLRGIGGGYTSTASYPVFVGVPGPHTVALVGGSAAVTPGTTADLIFDITGTGDVATPDVRLSLSNLPAGSTYIQVQSGNRIWVKLTIPASTRHNYWLNVNLISVSGVYITGAGGVSPFPLHLL
jgi:hypothetical protein